MIFKQIKSGGDRNYAYLIGCSKNKKGVLVDPSPDPNRCNLELKKANIELIYIINTHDHFDHTGGNDYFLESNKVKLITHPSSNGDIKVKNHQIIKIGTEEDPIDLKFIHTPGHTKSSICIHVKNNLITGDTLFVGKVGGTYTAEDARDEFESLKILMQLPSETIVWPGHNYGLSPNSTIGDEIKNNPFIKRLNNFNDFIHLKNNWAEYKLKHGIK